MSELLKIIIPTDTHIRVEQKEQAELPQLPLQVPKSKKGKGYTEKGLMNQGPSKITLAEFIWREDEFRRIRLLHGLTSSFPFLETDPETGLVVVELCSFALWSNAAAEKLPYLRLKPGTVSTEYASIDDLHTPVDLPSYLTRLHNVFAPQSPTQLMIATGNAEAGELLSKFVHPLSLVVPEEFRQR